MESGDYPIVRSFWQLSRNNQLCSQPLCQLFILFNLSGHSISSEDHIHPGHFTIAKTIFNRIGVITVVRYNHNDNQVENASFIKPAFIPLLATIRRPHRGMITMPMPIRRLCMFSYRHSFAPSAAAKRSLSNCQNQKRLPISPMLHGTHFPATQPSSNAGKNTGKSINKDRGFNTHLHIIAAARTTDNQSCDHLPVISAAPKKASPT